MCLCSSVGSAIWPTPFHGLDVLWIILYVPDVYVLHDTGRFWLDLDLYGTFARVSLVGFV